MIRLLSAVILLVMISTSVAAATVPTPPKPGGTASPAVADSVADASNYTVALEGGTSSLPLSELIGNSVDVRSFGAKCDGINVSDAAITAGSNVLSSSTHTFVASDIGKEVSIKGAGSGGDAFNSTISTVVSGNAVLSTNAITTVSGAVADFGTDDTTAFKSAVSYMKNYKKITTIPPAICIITSKITFDNNTVFYGFDRYSSILKWISPSTTVQSMFEKIGDATHLVENTRFDNFTIDMWGQLTSGYSSGYKAIYSKYMKNSVVRDMYIVGTPATSIGIDRIQRSIVTGNIVMNAGRKNSGSDPGGACIGIGIGGLSNESYDISNNFTLYCKRFGIFTETQTTSTELTPRAIISNNYILQDSSNGVGIADVGMTGTIISGNQVYYTSASTSDAKVNVGVLLSGGTLSKPASIQTSIVNNNITGAGTGIYINYSDTIPSVSNNADLLISNNRINNSTILGVAVVVQNGYTVNGLKIQDNFIYNSAKECIKFSGTGTGGSVENAMITGNHTNACGSSASNTYSALAFANTGANSRNKNIIVSGNDFSDKQNSPTQRHAVEVFYGASYDKLILKDNNLENSASSPLLLSASATYTNTIIKDNSGYNPAGASSVTPSASPWTYAAGKSPETLYLYGGVVSSVTIGGVQVASSSPSTIKLPPNKSAVITYSVAPSATTYIE